MHLVRVPAPTAQEAAVLSQYSHNAISSQGTLPGIQFAASHGPGLCRRQSRARVPNGHFSRPWDGSQSQGTKLRLVISFGTESALASQSLPSLPILQHVEAAGTLQTGLDGRGTQHSPLGEAVGPLDSSSDWQGHR